MLRQAFGIVHDISAMVTLLAKQSIACCTGYGREGTTCARTTVVWSFSDSCRFELECGLGSTGRIARLQAT